MRTDKKIIDSQLSAIESMKSEFLRFANYSEVPSSVELKARHERIKEALTNCGGSLDGYWVIWLFGELEQRATEELRKVTLLAQTTDPGALKDRYFPDLPKQLVDNVKTVQKHLSDTGLSNKGNAKKKELAELLWAEIVYRAKWFIDNPVPGLINKPNSYRVAELARHIEAFWEKRKIIDPTGESIWVYESWENNSFSDVPSLNTIEKYIRVGVKNKELPAYLSARGRPKE